MKKQAISLFLALLSLSLACASCGEASQTPASGTEALKNNETEAVTEEEKQPSAYDLLETRDFGGKTYTELDANSHPEFHVNIPGDELTGELVNDALINRDTAVEDRFNIKLDYVQEANCDKLKKAVLAGEHVYDLCISTMGDLANLASAGVLCNLCDLPEISLKENWWSPLMADALKLNNAMYFTAGDIAPAVYQSPCCMFLNLKLYQDYDIDTDIYQLVLDGKWTLDALETLTKDMDVDVNGDSKWDTDNDIYGIGMQPTSETTGAFLSGAGISLCSFSADGTNLVFDALDNPRTEEACARITKIARDIPYSDINDVINKTFKENRALFLQHKLESAAVHLRDMEADYLILPDPKYDEAQETYISFVSIYVVGFTGIPMTADMELAGFITEALARYSHEYLRPIAYDLVYKQKDTRDPRSADVLDLLFDNLYIDFTSVYNFGSVNDSLTTVIFKDKPYASTLEKKRSSVDKAIVKLVENWNTEG